MKDYVEERDGDLRITGQRVSLGSIVYPFLRGEPPESIADAFPALSLEEVYGAITYYLANRQAVDARLLEMKGHVEQARTEARARSADLLRRLQTVKENARKPVA
jgi:uncharacterized protein (DUF433 family)